jgi:anti-sigma-K factor RskA
MNDANHERWSEDLSAYLLGALEPNETEALERHVGGCDRCRTELRWLAPALDALPETVERVEPSPQLRARLLAEVREDARRTRAATAPDPKRPGLLAWLRGVAGPHWRPLAAGAAMLLIAAAVVGYAVGNGGGSGGGGKITSVQANGSAGLVAAVSMEGTAHGRIKLSNVGPLPHDKVLEAWLERDGTVEAVPALFVPNGEGEAATVLGDMDGVTTVMVTEEPPGGSEVPTAEPIVEVPLPKS